MKNSLNIKHLALCSVAITFALTASAQNRDVYRYNRKAPTLSLQPYSCTAYTASANTVNTMRGDLLHSSGKDTIVNFKLNPTGVGYLVVERDKKGRTQAETYSAFFAQRDQEKFKNKKYGKPAAAAYSPDAKKLYMATSDSLLILNPQTLLRTGAIDALPFAPTELYASPNGYMLVAVNGSKAAIYNAEDNKLRKVIDQGEKITDIAFSPDNASMALLTNEGVLYIYSTRSLDVTKMIEDLGSGIACDYNFDGKYIAIITEPDNITLINLLNTAEREDYDLEGTGATDIRFIADAANNTMMTYAMADAVKARRMTNLKPYYGKLIAEESNHLMDEWLKMQEGETLDQYKARVNQENQARQRAMFEYQIATQLIGNPLAGTVLTPGTYDRTTGMLALEAPSMPTIFIPVPEDEISAFAGKPMLSMHDMLYGVNPDDSFDLVYARIHNAGNDKDYIFDNLQRKELSFLNSDNLISIEVLQQQQMEELKLKELREKVMQEARNTNVISDHTNITVNSRLVPDYDASGERVLNYVVSFSYEVEPGFSAQEDFAPGKYHVEESGAASSMLKIVKEAFEGDMQQYLTGSRRMRVNITGSADATPILRGLAYDGSYGTHIDAPVYVDGQLTALTVDPSQLIKTNPQLAYLRALGVQNFLDRKVEGYAGVNKDYRYEVNVSQDKGSEFRRINLDFTFVDAF